LLAEGDYVDILFRSRRQSKVLRRSAYPYVYL